MSKNTAMQTEIRCFKCLIMLHFTGDECVASDVFDKRNVSSACAADHCDGRNQIIRISDDTRMCVKCVFAYFDERAKRHLPAERSEASEILGRKRTYVLKIEQRSKHIVYAAGRGIQIGMCRKHANAMTDQTVCCGSIVPARID